MRLLADLFGGARARRRVHGAAVVDHGPLRRVRQFGVWRLKLRAQLKLGRQQTEFQSKSAGELLPCLRGSLSAFLRLKNWRRCRPSLIRFV
jgi:hypothetical protein